MLVAPAPELVDVHPKFLSHRLQRSTALLSQLHRFGLELRHEPASRPGHWSPSGWNRSTLATRPFRRGKLSLAEHGVLVEDRCRILLHNQSLSALERLRLCTAFRAPLAGCGSPCAPTAAAVSGQKSGSEIRGDV